MSAKFKLHIHPGWYDKLEFDFTDIKHFIKERWGYENAEVNIVADLNQKNNGDAELVFVSDSP